MRRFGRFSSAVLLSVLLAPQGPALAFFPNSQESSSPRIVEVPALAGDLELRDQAGTVIPLTGDGTTERDGTTYATPPRLPPGSYRLSWGAGEQAIEVQGPGEEAGETGTDGRLPLAAAAAAATLGIVLLQRRRLVLGGAMILLPAMLLVGAGSRMLEPVPACDAEAGYEETLACMQGLLYEVADAEGFPAALAAMRERQQTIGGDWLPFCHTLTHTLGSMAWVQDPDVSVLIGNEHASECSFGFLHGAMVSMAAYSTDQEFSDSAYSLCERVIAGVDPALDYEVEATTDACHHGLGHAAMWRYGLDLDRARQYCNSLPGQEERDDCNAGAVMEWMIAAASSYAKEYRPAPDSARPLEFCSETLGTLTLECAESVMAYLPSGEVEGAAEWCQSAGASSEAHDILQWHRACVQSLLWTVFEQSKEPRGAEVSDLVRSVCVDHPWETEVYDCATRAGYLAAAFSSSAEAARDLCAALAEPTPDPRYAGRTSAQGDRAVSEYCLDGASAAFSATPSP